MLVESDDMRGDAHCLLNAFNGGNHIFHERVVLLGLLEEQGLDEGRLAESALA